MAVHLFICKLLREHQQTEGKISVGKLSGTLFGKKSINESQM